jgi:hypothetical protein
MLARLSELTPAVSTKATAGMVDGLTRRAREEFAVESDEYQYPIMVFESQLAQAGVSRVVREVALKPWEGRLHESRAAITRAREKLLGEGEPEATLTLL